MPFDVFISYANRDKAAADATCAALEAARIRCWIAPRDILPGADWGGSIIDAIDHCRIMVLIFSANANGSPQIRNEVVHAVQRGVTVIPVRIENVAPIKSLAYYMGAVHWLDALPPPLEAHLARLAESVRAMLQLAADAPQLPLQSGEAPPAADAASYRPKSSPLSVDHRAAAPRRSLRLPAVVGAAAVLLAIGSGFWFFHPAGLSLLVQDSPQPSEAQQAAPPAPSAAAAPPSASVPRDAQSSAEPKGAVLQHLLLARLVAVVPKLTLLTRERIAREYAEAKGHKAQAVSYKMQGTWRATDRDSEQLAEVAALENCQIYFGQPCVLIAVNNTLLPVPEDDNWPPRDMPRVRYAGNFDPDQLPGVGHLRQRPDIAGYAAAAEPKAIAIHPASQMFVVTGTASQRTAEERVLDVCNKDTGRPNGLGPCYLYAVRNQVVLPQRLTKPLTQN